MNEVKDRSISPWLVRELLCRPDALVTTGKIVFADSHNVERGEKPRSFGGFTGMSQLAPSPRWKMVAGTLVIIPMRTWEGQDTRMWDLCDILKEGLDPNLWKKIK